MTTPTFRDVELLSAYVDGALTPSEAARLETRLRADPQLRAVMDDLRAARGVLRKLPSRRAPRNFTLTPRMAGIKPPVPRSYPALRFASALATLLLVFSFAINALSRPIAFGAAAPAIEPAFGMGGGGGGGAPDEPQAPAAEQSTDLAPQATQEAADATRLAPAPTATAAVNAKGFANDSGARSPAGPISAQWQVVLLLLAILLAGAAWLVRYMNDRTWPSKK